MSCNCVNPNDLLNQTNSILGGCYPTPTFSNGGSYVGVLLTSSSFTLGTISNTAISSSAISGSSVTGLPTPTASTDAATKSYVDAAAYSGPDVHAACNAATVGNVTLAGGTPSTLDGVTLALNNRILVKDQTDNRQNGIYYVSTLGTGVNGTWGRAADADASGELKVGAEVQVQYGTVNGGSNWKLVGSTVPVIGTSAIVFIKQYGFSAIPAALVTGQLADSQIAALSSAKLFGTVTVPYIYGTGNNRVGVNDTLGWIIGNPSSNGAIYSGGNGAGTGVRTLWDGYGHSAEVNAPLASISPVTLTLKNDANTTYVNLSSSGTLVASGTGTFGGPVSVTGSVTLTSGSFIGTGLSITGNGVVSGDLNVNGSGGLTVTVGGVALTSGNLTLTSGNAIIGGNLFFGSTGGTLSGTVFGSTVRVIDKLTFDGKTITPIGTTGARTIDEIVGSVNFASGATSLVVTNSLVTADSVILVTKGTNDSTARLGAVVAAAGSFTIYMDVAPSAACRVNFLVTN